MPQMPRVFIDGGIYLDYLGRSTVPERPRLAVDEYLDRACEALGVDADELASRGREPRLRELRELVAVLGVERYGQRVGEIAGGAGHDSTGRKIDGWLVGVARL